MKFTLLSLGLLALVSTMSPADEPLRVGLDGTKGVAAPAVESGKDGIDRIHAVEVPQLEVFPNSSKPAKGTIMISPGGGYGILAVTHEGRTIAKLLNDAGWDAAVLLYQVSAGPTTRDLALADAKQGLELIQKRGGEFGLATNRIGIMGFSAGGHLTARLAHEAAAGKPVDFVVLIYPAYLEKDGKVLDDVAPTKTPAFLYVAGDDKYHTSAMAYDAACKEQNIADEFHMPEKGGHGFGLKENMPESVKDWPVKLKAFLEKLPAAK